jgi:O-antigen/teichoic acid export membrane protein
MIEKIKAKLINDKNLKELLSGGLLSLLLRVFGMTIGYISMLYITNIYGGEMFGTLTLLITIVAIFSVIPKFGMDVALVKIIGELLAYKNYKNMKEVCKTVFIFTLLLSIIFALLLYFSSGLIAQSFLNKPYIQNNIQLISMTVVSIVIIAVVGATLQGMKKIKEFIFVQTILQNLVFLVFLLVNGFLNITDNLIYIYIISIVTSAIFSISFILVENIYPTFANTNNKVNRYDFKRILITASPMLLYGLYFLLIAWADILMLGFYTTETDIGIYSASQRMAGLTGIVLTAITSILAPKFIELYSKKDNKNLKKVVQQSTKIIFFTTTPLLLVYLLFPSLIMGLFGNEFIVGSTVLIFISIATFVASISGSVGYLMLMTDNQIILRNVTFVTAFLNVVLNYILIPEYGIDGAGFATMVSMIFWNITLVVYIKKKLGFWTVYIPNPKDLINV